MNLFARQKNMTIIYVTRAFTARTFFQLYITDRKVMAQICGTNCCSLFKRIMPIVVIFFVSCNIYAYTYKYLTADIIMHGGYNIRIVFILFYNIIFSFMVGGFHMRLKWWTDPTELRNSLYLDIYRAFRSVGLSYNELSALCALI